MNTLPDALRTPLCELLLTVADDKLMLGHRNADWTGLGPILEEDIAFSSLAQDDLAHALALYEMIAELTAKSADAIAYGRSASEYRCAQLLEVTDDFDWSVAIVRQFLSDHFEQLRLTRLAGSAYTPLRQLATRLLAEERLSIGHADQWVVRLGNADDAARQKMQAALSRLAPLASGLFEAPAGVETLESAGVYPQIGDMFDQWKTAVENVIEAATLSADFARPAAEFVGGRHGRHSDGFAELLSEMTEVYRTEPSASW